MEANAQGMTVAQWSRYFSDPLVECPHCKSFIFWTPSAKFFHARRCEN